MNDKKPNDYKVSWGIWREVWEILVPIVLAICLVYAIYSFFHQEETESDNAGKVKSEKVEKEGKASGGYRMKLNNLKPKSLGDDAIAGAS